MVEEGLTLVESEGQEAWERQTKVSLVWSAVGVYIFAQGVITVQLEHN